MNNGIALIALVACIIVILILCGVTIATIAGREGLFNRAKDASQAYNSAQYNEINAVNRAQDRLQQQIDKTKGEGAITQKK